MWDNYISIYCCQIKCWYLGIITVNKQGHDQGSICLTPAVLIVLGFLKT